MAIGLNLKPPLSWKATLPFKILSYVALGWPFFFTSVGRATNGGLPVNNSYSVMPSAQRSHALVYLPAGQ